VRASCDGGIFARVEAETSTVKSAAALMEVSYQEAKRLDGAASDGGGTGPLRVVRKHEHETSVAVS
jgi:hypothetical protein